jgi:hypothetical protein
MIEYQYLELTGAGGLLSVLPMERFLVSPDRDGFVQKQGNKLFCMRILVVSRRQRRQRGAHGYGGLRPITRNTRNKPKPTTNRILASQAAVPANPPKHSSAAIIAIVRNVTAQPNMAISSFLNQPLGWSRWQVLPSLRICAPSNRRPLHELLQASFQFASAL